jgi:hypothetical protein
MKRFGVGAALAMVIGASLSLVAMSGAYATGVACKKVSGTATGTFTISSCLPLNSKYLTAGAKTSSLATGSGTITWKPSLKTTIIKTTFTPKGHGGCGTGNEFDIAGSVKGGTATYTHIGDIIKARICDSTAGSLSLVPGTTMTL